MTAVRIPGASYVDGAALVSTNPCDGSEVARLPVATAADVAAVVAAAAEAGRWWAALGFAERRRRLLRLAALLARRIDELAGLIHEETGKPVAEAVLEVVAAVEHLSWAGRNAHRVLGARRVAGSWLQPEYSARVEYLPYGVVGVIGPWNYPVFTPLGSIGSALAAGNAVVFKPSEYTPAVGRWLVDLVATVVPGHRVLRGIQDGRVCAALCAGTQRILHRLRGQAQGVRPARRPVLLECGGKDAAVVAADADLAAAADACVWGGMTNAGQTCVGIERVYVVDDVYTEFLSRLVDRARRLSVGSGPDADLGPITMPGQLDTIRRHIEDALIRGGRAVLGGAEAVQPPYVLPTILVDVPEDSLAAAEETFGPTLTVCRVRDTAEALRLANAGRYGLGGAVFSRAGGVGLARGLRSGMTAVNSVLSFAGVGSVPFGGVGASGFGRVHGADGLREFAWAKAITVRRFRSPVPTFTFDRTPGTMRRVVALVRLLHGRQR
jgi:acyl-CoA reductase-like NAD-dependent aldehyde dehydrogenase